MSDTPFPQTDPIDASELLALIQQRNPLLVEACMKDILIDRLRRENADLRSAAGAVAVPAASEIPPGTTGPAVAAIPDDPTMRPVEQADSALPSEG